MKIIKRDGRIVDYNPEKIVIAINKANNEVLEEERIDEKSIKKIISYIEKLGKNRMLVEDIQDIIEQKLMEFKKFELAKKYIIYRYTRSIIRKTNTTDANILSLLKNNDYNEENYLTANRQRDLMAGAVSKDLAYRLLLPKNVVTKEKENLIKYCNVEYFTEPTIESSYLNIEDMFENGTVINGVKIESPKSFQSACNILIEIIASVSSLQTGNIYINVKDLFKYFYITYEKNENLYSSVLKEYLNKEQIEAISTNQSFKEVVSGVQTLYYQINTIMTSNALVPKVYFMIDTKDISNSKEEFIVYEIIKQKLQGIILENNETSITNYPKIIYCLNKDNMEEENEYFYLTDEILKLDKGFLIMNEKKYKNYLKSINKIGLGTICINLPKLALKSKEDNISFHNLLDEILDTCYEGFLCKKHNLQGIYSGKSPIHFRFGAIARLKTDEKIDKYLTYKQSKFNLIIIGIDDVVSILNNEIKKESILDLIKQKINSWNDENNIFFELNNYYSDDVIKDFREKDLEETDTLGDYSYESNDYDFCNLSDLNFFFKLNDETLNQINEKNVIFYR